MKRIIFFLTFPLFAVIVLVFTVIQEIARLCENLCHMWEGYMLDYYKEGYKRDGGVWVKHFSNK